MSQYRLNVPLAVATTALVVVLLVGTHFLHAWQMRQHARAQLDRADAAERTGDTKEITASLGRYTAFAPDDLTVRTRHAMILAEQATTHRQRLHALVLLRSVLPGRRGSLEVRLRAVNLALETNLNDEAVRLLRPSLEANPTRGDLRELLARAQAASGKFADAASSLEQALEIDPSQVKAAATLGQLYTTRLDQPKRGAAVLDRLVKANPKLPAAYLTRAKARADAGQLAKAEEDLRVARNLDATDVDVLSSSAELARLRGLPLDAQVYFERAVALHPDNPTAALGLARTRREQGKLEDALELVHRTRVKHPNNTDLTYLLADLLIDKGDHGAAETEAAKLPESAKGRRLFLEGRLALSRRSPNNAVKSFLAATYEQDLPGGLAYLELVRAYGELGYINEQILAAREAVRLASTPENRVLLARIMVAAGFGKEVEKDLRELETLPSPPEGIWAPLARIAIDRTFAVIDPKRRDWTEAEKYLKRAAATVTDQTNAALLRATMLERRERPGAALSTLRNARQARPNESPLYLAEADLAARQGDRDRARSLLAEGDKRFGDRADWLTVRARRLVNEQAARAAPMLAEIERKSAELTAQERDRALVVLAELYLALEYYDHSQRLCEQVLRGNAHDMTALVVLVHAKVGRGDLSSADSTLESLRQVEGREGVFWRFARASLLLRQTSNFTSRQEARRLLDEATKLRPAWSRPWLLLAQLDDAEGRDAEALQHYQRALTLGEVQPHAVGRTAALLATFARDNEADRLLEQAELTGVVLRPEALRIGAEIALRAGRFERATRLARQTVAILPKHYHDLLWLARILESAKHDTEADEAFVAAASQAPEVPEVWLAQMARNLRLGKRKEAERGLTYMETFVRRDRLRVALGRGYELLGRLSEAEQMYRSSLKLRANDPEALRRLADLHVRRAEFDKATEVLTVMLDGSTMLPEEEMPQIRRRLALTTTWEVGSWQRREKALALLALNRHGEKEAAADRRATLLVRGSGVAARTEALDNLELLPGSEEMTPLERLYLARLYQAEGRWLDARKQYTALLTRDKDNVAYLGLLIDGLIVNKKFAEANSYLKRLQKIQPDSPRTLALSETLQAAEIGSRQ